MNKPASYTFLVIILFIALLGIFIALGKESYRKYQLDKEISDLKKEIESLKEKNQALSNSLDYFNSGTSLEKEARLKLNLSKKGEKLIIISPEEKVDSANKNTENTQEGQISNFKKWVGYFGIDN